MSCLRFDDAVAPLPRAGAGKPRPRGERGANLGKGLAAFLLGLMLGITGIVLGQSAFRSSYEDSPPLELRR